MNAPVHFFGYFNFGGNGNGPTNNQRPSNSSNGTISLCGVEKEKSSTTETATASTNAHQSSGVYKAKLMDERKQMISSKCQTFYAKDPIVVSRASMQFIFDENGNRFLDCISNVQHVGHCHPHIIRQISTQLGLSTCNIRFISPMLTKCADALLRTLPPQLDTVLFCNSGSEANDLALQLARDWSGAHDMIVLENAYHGHITTAVQMSPYKFQHGANITQPEWVHIAPVPDVYRGKHRLPNDQLRCPEQLNLAGELYAEELRQLLESIKFKGRRIAGFIAEALQSCGGQIIPPATYFPAIANAVHSHGGMVIVDEVQTGFGRVGNTFWAHQLDGKDFIPDIVTMGKPMGNGYPMAAVVTRREIAGKMCGAAEYFNTYGGNPVSCAAVLATLDVIERDHLLEHSQKMGGLFEKELNSLMAKHECIGDVRGVGMFWGLDLVKCRQSREPATELAARLILKLRQEHGVLLNADGPHGNILKFKPPLCFDENDLRIAIGALDSVLKEFEVEEKSKNKN